jgi:hypothetical protein
MSARLKRNINFLKILQKASPKQRKAIIATGSQDLILCISEIVDNVLKGNVKLSPKQKKQLSRYKAILRQLGNKKLKATIRRKLLVQKGGFLSALLGPVIGIAAGLIGDLLQR